MRNSQLAKREIAVARQSASASAARMRGKMEVRLAETRAKLRDAKLSGRTSMVAGAGFAAVGAVAGGQVARMTLFPTKEGVNRSYLVNLGIGVVALGALSSGKLRNNELRAVAAVGVGMGIAQLGIMSYTQWDLVPGTIFGA